MPPKKQYYQLKALKQQGHDYIQALCATFQIQYPQHPLAPFIGLIYYWLNLEILKNYEPLRKTAYDGFHYGNKPITDEEIQNFIAEMKKANTALQNLTIEALLDWDNNVRPTIHAPVDETALLSQASSSKNKLSTVPKKQLIEISDCKLIHEYFAFILFADEDTLLDTLNAKQLYEDLKNFSMEHNDIAGFKNINDIKEWLAFFKNPDDPRLVNFYEQYFIYESQLATKRKTEVLKITAVISQTSSLPTSSKQQTEKNGKNSHQEKKKKQTKKHPPGSALTKKEAYKLALQCCDENKNFMAAELNKLFDQHPNSDDANIIIDQVTRICRESAKDQEMRKQIEGAELLAKKIAAQKTVDATSLPIPIELSYANPLDTALLSSASSSHSTAASSQLSQPQHSTTRKKTPPLSTATSSLLGIPIQNHISNPLPKNYTPWLLYKDILEILYEQPMLPIATIVHIYFMQYEKFDEAITFLQNIDITPDTTAQIIMAILILLYDKEKQRAREILEKIAPTSPIAALFLGTYFMYITNNFPEAIEIYQPIIKMVGINHRIRNCATVNLAICYAETCRTAYLHNEQTISENERFAFDVMARQWNTNLETAASCDRPILAYLMAGFYERGNIVQKDLNKAFLLYKAAAQSTAPPPCYKAQYQLAKYYFHGYGCEANREESMRWYQEADKNGHPLACHAISFLQTPFNPNSYSPTLRLEVLEILYEEVCSLKKIYPACDEKILWLLADAKQNIQPQLKQWAQFIMSQISCTSDQIQKLYTTAWTRYQTALIKYNNKEFHEASRGFLLAIQDANNLIIPDLKEKSDMLMKCSMTMDKFALYLEQKQLNVNTTSILINIAAIFIKEHSGAFKDKTIQKPFEKLQRALDLLTNSAITNMHRFFPGDANTQKNLEIFFAKILKKVWQQPILTPTTEVIPLPAPK